MATGDTDRAGSNDTWAIDPASLDAVTNGVHGLAAVANIPHRGEAGHQGVHAVVNTEDLDVGVRQNQPVPVAVRAQLTLEMDMHVHEARHDETVAQIDILCTLTEFGGIDEPRADFRDSLAVNHDGAVLQDRLSRYRQQFTCMNDLDRFGQRRNSENREDECSESCLVVHEKSLRVVLFVVRREEMISGRERV
jgi:hypothetical protein